MAILEFCKAPVVVVSRDSTVTQAARKMRESHVGDVVVCDKQGGVSKPIGILTDRDIVVSAVALDVPLKTIRIEDIMTPSLVTVHKKAGIYEAIHLMETYGVRRLPIVGDKGELLGIISSGDLLGLLGEEIMALSRLPHRQVKKEQEVRL